MFAARGIGRGFRYRIEVDVFSIRSGDDRRNRCGVSDGAAIRRNDLKTYGLVL